MITFNDVSFQYQDQSTFSLKNINLTIKQGECIVLTGESGCGKTTLTRLVNGLTPRFYSGKMTGQLSLDGKAMADWSNDDLYAQVGSVFQHPQRQFFNLDSTSEIAFGCENIGLNPEEILQRMQMSVAMLGIEHLCDCDLFTLSGGEKQLVAIASVLALMPSVIVFDEPSASLDSASTLKLAQVIKKLKALGKTLIIAEHRLYYLMDIADRLVYMREGEIVEIGSTDQPDSLLENYPLRAFSLHSLQPSANILPKKEDKQLQFEHISIGYHQQKPLISDLSFSAYAGEAVAIIGRNGTGKSTLAKTLCGLHSPLSGKLVFNQKELKNKHRLALSYLIMQEPNDQLIMESVAAELQCTGTKQKKLDKVQLIELLEQLNLREYQACHPLSLSGGQKQRTVIGVGLTQQVEILIFDEPTSGLDFTNMNQVTEVIEQLRQQGKWVFIITHDYEFLLATCQRYLAVSDHGHWEQGEISVDNLHKLALYFMSVTQEKNNES